MNGTERAEQLFKVMGQRVIRDVAESCGSVRRIRVAAGDLSLEVEWPGGEVVAVPVAPVPDGVSSRPAEAPMVPEPAAPVLSEAGVVVRAPLVGTFYHAPEPGARPFVAVGDVVTADDQVGIVEAMKLMNPVSAETAGRVTEILVTDGQPVEYDQPLMVILPVD
ncbi:acetyl-CoA carboxylase biotin carboxyl carrier protein [Paractinoplanes ferrugineus]|uniref:acetyl-CoA carboxylase biotin carboxyl carrier protein n=1 Tax=Paractinoplanes ferrugineus TaxID=113564 RepID=UPI001EF288EB|nr:acetyl-CoA carboxylase biotin carboxyl carrier protein [Actinoplanes ferrugineus]